MFKQPPPDRVNTMIPLRGLAIGAAGMGVGFGLCGVMLLLNSPNAAGAGAYLFGGSFIGLIVCAIWAALAAIINSLRGPQL